MFDIEAIKKTITDALQDLYDENYPAVKASITDYLKRLDERLAAVSAAGITQQIDGDFFAARMKDELLLLQNELVSLEILGFNVIQSAISKAIEEVLKLILPKDSEESDS